MSCGRYVVSSTSHHGVPLLFAQVIWAAGFLGPSISPTTAIAGLRQMPVRLALQEYATTLWCLSTQVFKTMRESAGQQLLGKAHVSWGAPSCGEGRLSKERLSSPMKRLLRMAPDFLDAPLPGDDRAFPETRSFSVMRLSTTRRAFPAGRTFQELRKSEGRPPFLVAPELESAWKSARTQ